MNAFSYPGIHQQPQQKQPADAKPALPSTMKRPNTKRTFWVVVSLRPDADELTLESYHDSKRIAEQQANKLSARHIHTEYIVMRPQSHFAAVINVSKGRFW